MEETFTVLLHFVFLPNVWCFGDTDLRTHFGVDGGVGSHINSKQRLTAVHKWKVMGGTLQRNESGREIEAKVHTF